MCQLLTAKVRRTLALSDPLLDGRPEVSQIMLVLGGSSCCRVLGEELQVRGRQLPRPGTGSLHHGTSPGWDRTTGGCGGGILGSEGKGHQLT